MVFYDPSSFGDVTAKSSLTGYCPYCSQPPLRYVYHSGRCPEIAEIEYYPDGRIKKILFK